MNPFPARFRPAGSAGPAVVIVVALLLSAAVFYFYTSRKLEERRDSEPPIAATPVQPSPNPEPEPQAMTPAEPPAPPPPAPKPAPQKRFGFATPQDLGGELMQQLAEGDWEGSGALAAAGQGDAEQAAAVLKTLVERLGFQPDPNGKAFVVGQQDQYTRLALPFTDADGKPLKLHLELERDPRMGWKVAQFKLPQAMAEALSALPADPAAQTPAMAAVPGEAGADPKPQGKAGSPMTRPNPEPSKPLFVVETEPDALTRADAFVQALIGQDFPTARGMVDAEKVSPERLAGLCIVFEEGDYEVLASKPLVMTVADTNSSWVIAQVRSNALNQATAFGLEMQRAEEGADWQVVGLNLSEILGSFAQSASKIGVPYTPIVTNPQGGESLALYFEYDTAELHPRAKRQLSIVAELLKSDADRQLKIAGHTDAKGTDAYNLGLSQKRAEAVKVELVAQGVPATQVATVGLGKEQPLGPNQKQDGTDDPEGRSKNRRAEIFLDF